MIKSQTKPHKKRSKMEIENKASAWLVQQRTARHLSQRELARQLKVSNTLISDAEKGVATHETWRILARYFRMPAEYVLRLAGFLGDALPDKDELILQIESDLQQMDRGTREQAARIIRSLISDT
jgi:transcriptional regulator with XRE-family HTH domain